MRRWPFAPDCGGAKRTEKNRLLRLAAHTWEADLHGDGGSHNHQCITTKATLGGEAGSRQTPPHPLSLLHPPIPPPLLLPSSAIVSPSEESCVRPHGPLVTKHVRR